jgi:hypothetical protein
LVQTAPGKKGSVKKPPKKTATLKAYLYDQNGAPEGLQFRDDLPDDIYTGTNILTGLAASDLPPNIPFDSRKWYFQRYSVFHRSAKSAKYRLSGYGWRNQTRRELADSEILRRSERELMQLFYGADGRT